jgi:hypothetical protein
MKLKYPMLEKVLSAVDPIVFALGESDIQAVSEEALGRRLTKAEMNIVRNKLEIDWVTPLESLLLYRFEK